MSETSNKQHQQLLESVSALVDGEASELELRRLLKEGEHSADVSDCWKRYQAVSASVRKDVPNVAFQDLSASISAAIAEEPAHSVGATTEAQSTKSKNSIWSGVGRFAVAASVAGAVVLGVQFSPSGTNNQIAGNEVSPAAAVQPSVQPTIPSGFETGLDNNTTISTVSNANTIVKDNSKPKPIVITESTKQQLQGVEQEVNRLMLEHAQNASQNTQQGVLPFMRVPESSEQK